MSRVFVRCAADVFRLPEVRALRDAEQEHQYAVGLDHQLMVLVVHLAAVGTVDSVRAPPRDVFRELIRHNCSQFVFIHNHPGGQRRPSRNDREVTAWYRCAGDWLEVPLVAHVLVPGRNGPPVDVPPSRVRGAARVGTTPSATTKRS